MVQPGGWERGWTGGQRALGGGEAGDGWLEERRNLQRLEGTRPLRVSDAELMIWTLILWPAGACEWGRGFSLGRVKVRVRDDFGGDPNGRVREHRGCEGAWKFQDLPAINQGRGDSLVVQCLWLCISLKGLILAGELGSHKLYSVAKKKKKKSRERWADPPLTHHSLSNQVFTKHQ